ncbi:sensor histidine kinase [Mycobacterium numidiamassiliense]|uniref:Sensor histidine kinase n=1 Tax=Mycobacterium numidiamassiliense TaxID=1841861 RepID=A0A2U3PBE1_9MYCO|nr:ANTAR domain-containing protein [Mycobacterium numidiamassiliense]SPM41083.1 sensor histidine kinase [Mycobacterium numidiamassiliense]
MLDEHRLDTLAGSVVAEPSAVGVMLLDRDFRIRGANATYEAVSMRQREEMLGDFVFDVFPDDPKDPQASGSSQLLVSVEAAMRRRGTDTMPIFRYDIADPRNPDVFVAKLWTCKSTSVDDGGEQIGVLLHVAEITSLDQALSALSQNIAGGATLGVAEQLHVLSALAASVRADRDYAQAMARENEQLRSALETRDVIGQAKGMLMERFDVDSAAAFSLLTRLSQDSNTRLAHVAEKLIEIDHPRT